MKYFRFSISLLIITSVILSSRVSAALSQNEKERILVEEFSVYIYWPIAKVQHEYIKCDQPAKAVEWEGHLLHLAQITGFDVLDVRRKLLAEQYRCCQVQSRWIDGPCDLSELKNALERVRRKITWIHDELL